MGPVQFYVKAPGRPGKVAILPGSFNPPTVAHLELAHAAAAHVDEVVCVLPRAFPHKDYSGATLEQRIQMLQDSGLPPICSIAVTEGGLFLEIARECRRYYGPDEKFYLLCGRDAAERVLAWDYGRPGVAELMLQEFDLLVAPRNGDFHPPAQFRKHVRHLEIHPERGLASSTEVRERIAHGQPWEHLVPPPIAQRVREIYS
jgi:nicotinate-nucleotide adenylyltransferase